MIQEVVVDPILDPKIIAIAFSKEIIPAPIKESDISETIEEL